MESSEVVKDCGLRAPKVSAALKVNTVSSMEYEISVVNTTCLFLVCTNDGEELSTLRKKI